MKYDVSSILKATGASINVEGKVDLTTDMVGHEPVFHDDVCFSGVITNIGTTLEFVGRAEGTLTAHCARCTKEVTKHFDFEFSELLANRLDDITDKDAVIVFEGETVDLSDIVKSNIFVNLSFKYLCDIDCKGLCPICGADLNVTSCDCKSEMIDPRLEGLKKLLEEQ